MKRHVRQKWCLFLSCQTSFLAGISFHFNPSYFVWDLRSWQFRDAKTIETNQNKFHGISIWRLCITFVWLRASKKLPTTATSSDQNAIRWYFTLIRLCLALLFFISMLVYWIQILKCCQYRKNVISINIW